MPERVPPTLEQLARYAEGFNQSQTMRLLEVTLKFPDLKTAEIRLDRVQPKHRGGLGTDAVNGAVISGMFDLAIGVTPALLDPTKRSATVQLSIEMMRPVQGDSVVVRATIDRAGGVLLFGSAEAIDAQGNVCAKATGLVRLSQQTWAQGDSPAVN